MKVKVRKCNLYLIRSRRSKGTSEKFLWRSVLSNHFQTWRAFSLESSLNYRKKEIRNMVSRGKVLCANE